MRNRSVWQRMLGLARTVVEGVELEEASRVVVVAVRPVQRLLAAAGNADDGRVGTTTARGGAGGGPSTSASCAAI